jgi:hypothetical protein
MATINFDDVSISFSDAGLAGEKSLYPTALEFARSGEPVLFVAQQDGTIYRYVVERVGDGFEVSKDKTPTQTAPAALKIEDIKKGIANYDDDGSPGPVGARQITGLAVREEVVDGVERDVLYVTSSDNRIGGGGDANDENVDSNSSQIHRVVVDQTSGEVIDSVALVRGLPRSAENHAANGMDFGTDPATGDMLLYVAQGANTNKGSPSNNFVGFTETAWTGSVLKLNLTELARYDVRTDGQGERFVLDLPTLNDPARKDVDLGKLGVEGLELDPNFALDDNGEGGNGELNPDWAGGAQGNNSAKITHHVMVSEGGQLKLVETPLTLVQPGHRNNYDVLVTEGGEVITWDNGPNTGWGGEPLSFQDGKVVDDWRSDLATHDFNESQSGSYWDQLHIVGLVGEEAGPYAGFPNAIRAAKEALDLAFATDGSYRGEAPDAQIVDADGVVVFRDEAEARDFLARLMPIYEKVDGVWVDTRPTDEDGNPIVPSDLHDIVSGYDWAHPGSGIEDPKDHFDGPSIMDGHAFSPESQELPWGQDGSLILGSGSTNGLAQYTAGSWFDGALDGAVLATGWGGGKLLFTALEDTDGDGRTDAATPLGSIAGFGSKPLDVTALGDEGLGSFIDNNGDGIDDFSGLITAVTYGTHNVTTFAPGGTPTGADDDQDDDGVDDALDTHVGDPLDGRSVLAGDAPLRWDFVLSDPTSTPPGAAQPGGPAGGIGITAGWTNGRDAAVDGGLYDDANWDLGGASTFASSEEAHTGTADGEENSLRNVLGLGATLSKSLASATITTEMLNIFDYGPNIDTGKTWDGGEEAGLVVGPDQSDFMQAVIVRKGDGTVGLRLVTEKDDERKDSVFVEMPGLDAPASQPNQSSVVQLGFVLDLTPGEETVAARARYQNPDLDDDIGADAEWSRWYETEAVKLPSTVRKALHGDHGHLGRETGAVIGLYSATKPGDDGFAASWDWVEIDGSPVEGSGEETVVYRWNAGRSDVDAIDGGPDWIAAGKVVAAGTKTGFGTYGIEARDASVPDHVPQALFAEERWDGEAPPEWTLSFGGTVLGEPLAAGTYAVRIFMGDGFGGTSEAGQRKFDIDVEGQRLASEFDPTGTWGHATGGMLEWRGVVSDGSVDISFGHEVQNPQVNGVEIVALGAGAPPAPRVSVLPATLPEDAGKTGVTIQTDRPVPVGEMVTVQWEVRALDGGAVPGLDYTVPGVPLQGGVYSGTGSIAGGSSDYSLPLEILADSAMEGSEAFEVVVTGVSGAGATVDAAEAKVTIGDDDAPGGEGAVLYRVNAGGAAVSVEGADWEADQGKQAGGTAEAGPFSPHLVHGGGRGDRSYGFGEFAGQNNTGAPSEVFETERFEDRKAPLSYAFELDDGDYEVTLYFAELWSGGKEPGGRVFDVSVEGVTVLDDLDIGARYGWGVAGSETFAATVVDGALNVDLGREAGNPKIAAIEVRAAGGGDGPNDAPKDKAPGHKGDFSEAHDAPTTVTLGAGDNTVRATQAGDPRDYDHLTVVVPEGHQLTGITLEGYEDYDALASNGTFMGLAKGGTFPIEFGEAEPASKKLLGGVVYGSGSVGDDLMDDLGDGVIQGGGDAETKGFDGPLGPGKYTFGWSENQGMTTTTLNLEVEPMQNASSGAATLAITPGGGIQKSNYGAGSFQLTNTGDKEIASVTIDVSGALYPDAVFDPFGKAGDSTSKPLTIDSSGGTGVETPNKGSYIGKGGEDGYEAIKLDFSPSTSGGFDPGETVGFSIDMDPNSVAGSEKGPLDRGASPKWDVGGVSGAELAGSRFEVTFTDGSRATGQIIGDGSQSGAKGVASQTAAVAAPKLEADGFGPGSVGSYGDGGPAVTIQGQAGQTARVVLTKGFIQPVSNEFSGAYADQLDAQLAALAASGFPANNAVEFQTVDVALDGTVQDISALFDFETVPGVSLQAEDELPMGLVAAVVDGGGMPLSAVTVPIHLGHDPDAGDGGSQAGETQRIVVHAGGDVMGSQKPSFELVVDGRSIGTRTVENADAEKGESFEPYAFTYEGEAPGTVEIRFASDAYRAPGGRGNDVNLDIDKVVVNGATYEAELDGRITTADPGRQDRFGGSREAMKADGTMAFDAGAAPTEVHTLTVFAGGEALLKENGKLKKPKFDVFVDGEKIGKAKVKSADAEAYDGEPDAFVFEIAGPLPEEVEITFRNDAYRSPGGPGNDVTLYVDRIEVDAFVFEAEEDGVVSGQWGGARERMVAEGMTMTFDDLSYA